MKTLYKYAKNRYSQNGEDGILAEIFERLNIKKGWFVEFGAWDAKHMSNTYALLEDDWHGVDIEGDSDRYKDLQQASTDFPNKLNTIKAFVGTSGKNSLDNLLKKTPLPKEFDLLSIDTDSYDWWIWQAFKNYQPRVVVIEINSGIPLSQEYVQPNGITYEELAASGELSGASFTSMLKLGQQKSYALVCHTGNMIFVRNDLVSKLGLPQDELENPESLFIEDWVEKPKTFNLVTSWYKKVFSTGQL
ncbi:MAG TPA: hypothetical protein VLE51_00935 [Candidatus Saccharimonadales bacterium]|nr:hypothetical protein [Candidatus Saccharimonadales bacterium]